MLLLDYFVPCGRRGNITLKDKDRFQESQENDFFLLEFFELLTYVIEKGYNINVPIVFRLATLVSLYEERLAHPVTDITEVHSTGLKKDFCPRYYNVISLVFYLFTGTPLKQ